MGLPQLQAGGQKIDAVFTQMQTLWSAQINPVINRPQNKSVILSDVAIVAGVNTIQHGLGYPLSGWLIVLNSGNTRNAFTTGDVTSTSQSIASVGSTLGLLVGYGISGTGIPAGTSIIGLTATTIIMNQKGTATHSAVSLSFSGVPNIFDGQATNSTPEKTLILYANDSATISLEVF